MPRHLLSDRKCRSATPRAAGPYPLNDGDGLRLLVHPNGSKYWILRYTLAGRESTHSLGTYPETPLEQARRLANETRKLVNQGVSPAINRRIARADAIARSEATFGAIAAEWLERNRGHWSAHHHERNEGLLRRILLPKLGGFPVADITEPMLLKVLRVAYDSGSSPLRCEPEP